MHNAFLQSGLFLIQIIFSFYITLVVLRFLLQWVKADFYNPYCQFLIKLTNPLLLPLRRIIPGWFGIDLAALILAIVLQVIESLLIGLLSGLSLQPYNILASVLFVSVLMNLVSLILNIYFWAILIRAALSWINPNPKHPLLEVLSQLTEPVLRPIRKILPGMSGIDLSPLVALILIQVVLIFLRALFF